MTTKVIVNVSGSQPEPVLRFERPPAQVHFTRTEIEWCHCHRAVCMVRPHEEPTARAGPSPDLALWLE